ncbi:hypothetical protein JIN84_08095 [Luteolibacter yonseiensis]|uniref:Uncharacterized protein n=1 Tax=Luteolibacter yonseiensis TaxID=1144680 RepID=A0A934V6Z2_9BACT|nr:hypothetical protein [Luteolibacter yonseiensis]MBK1815572.1 hypothetical protein [Luteolibacter yonseiensis]
MDTQTLLRSFGKLSTIPTVAAMFLVAPLSHADIPDSSSGQFKGIYKIASSTDPIFPMGTDQEWFLDFGKGITSGTMSGKVAVSLRENPKVRVRIMVWQYFPKQGNIMIGNTYAEGSNKAVAKADWQLDTTSKGVIFKRDGYQIVMHRADPADY